MFVRSSCLQSSPVQSVQFSRLHHFSRRRCLSLKSLHMRRPKQKQHQHQHQQQRQQQQQRPGQLSRSRSRSRTTSWPSWRHRPPSTIHRPLIIHRLLSTVYCPLSTVHQAGTAGHCLAYFTVTGIDCILQANIHCLESNLDPFAASHHFSPSKRHSLCTTPPPFHPNLNPVCRRPPPLSSAT